MDENKIFNDASVSFKHSFFKIPKFVIGNNLILRNATIEDAKFIVDIRTNKKRSIHISQTSTEVKQQEAWLEKYNSDKTQVYFIINNQALECVGTVRLYDAKNDSFCWGSWILKEGVPNSYAIESALLVYHFALNLGFRNAHFDVRKGNESVWRFHERFGAERIGETSNDFLYKISLEAISASLIKYKKYLPNQFSITY